MKLLWLLCLVIVAVHAKLSKEREAKIRAMLLANGQSEEQLNRVRDGLKRNGKNVKRRLRGEYSKKERHIKKSRRLPSKEEQPGFEQDIQQINHAEGVDEFLFQGDMNILPDQMDAFAEPEKLDGESPVERSKRMAQVSDQSRQKWPVGKPINYRLNGTFSERQLLAIRKGIQWYHDNTCLNFVENGQGPEMTFVKETGCWSFVGYLGRATQAVSIGNGCEWVGTVVHEIAHALGFIHEQARQDRDQYITVDLNNVDKGAEGNFGIMGNMGSKKYLQEYDFGSIMHYAPYDFAVNPNQPVLIPNNALFQKSMGSDGVQLLDAVAISTHYECFNSCWQEALPNCLHYGHPHPRDCKKCLCPPAYQGDLCEKRNPGNAPQIALGTCGKDIIPTYVWNKFEVEVGADDAPMEAHECYWIIKTVTKSQKLEIRIPKVNGDRCAKDCFLQGGQIYLNDQANANHITFCCQSDLEGKTLSSNGTVAIRAYSRYRKARFTVEYRLV